MTTASSSPSRHERRARRLLARDGGTVLRPVAEGDGSGGDAQVEIAYVRTGPRIDPGTGPRIDPGTGPRIDPGTGPRIDPGTAPRSAASGGRVPVVLIPGGPGMGSVVPYEGLRKLATARGMDVLMMEHRGVGLSRRDTTGADLPRETVTVEAAADDLAAVLETEGIDQAVIQGASYGTYLAQVFAVRHPGLVHTLVLDSTMLDVEGDLAAARTHRRLRYWEGADATTARAAQLVRELSKERPMAEVAHVVQLVSEFAGPQVLERLAAAWLAGRQAWSWRALTGLGAKEIEGAGVPFLMEPDLVADISYGRLGYGIEPDGEPLDGQLFFADAATRMPPYRGESIDLPSHVPHYAWTTVVLSGERDLRTPPPVARRLVDLAPDGILLTFPETGHSLLDTHQLAALAVAHAASTGRAHQLPARVADLAALPRRGASGHLGTVLRGLVAADAVFHRTDASATGAAA